MTRRTAWRRAGRAAVAACTLLALAGAGCKPVVKVRMRTQVHADGSTVRETVIRKERKKDEGSKDAEENKRAVGKEFPPGFGSAFPKRTEDADEITLAGTFKSPSDVPPDFERAVEAVDGVSRNRISFRTEDILFGTRFLYRERFADAIEPEDLASARDALVDQCVRFVRAAARHELGREWSLDGFDAWAKTDLRAVLVDLLEIWYSERRSFGKKDPHTGESGLDRAWKRIRARLERAQLHLEPEFDAPLNRLLVEGWIGDLLASKLLRLDGGQRPRVEDFRYLFPEDEPWSGLDRVMRRTAELEYGSVENAGKSFERALIALTGTFDSSDVQYTFDCAVEMPGMLLRTNGNLETATSAFWLFEGDDLFPRGVTLELESVVLDDPICGRIRELKPVLDRRDAAWLIDRLEDQPAVRAEMRDALEQCARQGSLTWLDAPGDERRKRLKGLLAPVLEIVTK